MPLDGHFFLNALVVISTPATLLQLTIHCRMSAIIVDSNSDVILPMIPVILGCRMAEVAFAMVKSFGFVHFSRGM